MQGVCFDDSDGKGDGVCANRVKSVTDYLISVFCLVVGEQYGVVSEVLLYEAVDIDTVVMPDGSLDGVVPDAPHCSHLRRTARSQSKQSSCQNSQTNRHNQSSEKRISFMHRQEFLIYT